MSYEHDEWRHAVADLTEIEWARYEDRQTYDDTMNADGNRR